MRQSKVRRKKVPAHLAMSILLCGQTLVGATNAVAQINWESLENQLPNTVVVGPETAERGYHYERDRATVLIPDAFLDGGAAAVDALRRAINAGRIDSLIGLVLMAELNDRPALDKLGEYVQDPRRLVSFTRRVAAAVPFVLRYNLPDSVWSAIFVRALFKSPTYADSSMIVCLTEKDLPGSENAYWVAFRNVDSVSQRRIIARLAPECSDEQRLWKLLKLTGISSVQNIILDRLEGCQSSLWPAQADSLAHWAWGDAAHRVLEHASKTDTAVYRPLMRAVIYGGKTKEWVFRAIFALSAEGDTAAIPAIYSRIYESDRELRAVTCIGLCRLGDSRGVSGCIRIALKYQKYREAAIKALESCTGLAYGEDDEKWLEWLEKKK